MKRLILIPLAALALTACDPDIDMTAPPTVTVTETEVVTQTVEADPVIITRDPAKMVGPDRRQWGEKGTIGAQYLSYEVNAEITECWQAKEGIHVKARVTSNVDQVNDVSGTVEIMDPATGVGLGRTEIYVADMMPGDVVETQGFAFNVRADDFTCNFVLFEVIPPNDLTTAEN